MARLNQILAECKNGRNHLLTLALTLPFHWSECIAKTAREDKPAALKVVNTKKHTFESFMDTFLEAATRIANNIDLDSFCDPASPSPDE